MRISKQTNGTSQPHRRKFLERCFGANCGFAATLLLAPVAARRAYGQEPLGDVIGNRPFGRIEKIADGVWALVSTPFTAAGTAGDLSTHSNGGLIVGRDKILAIDSYRTQAGCKFMAEACHFLTGRLPTHVVHTHFHFDHLGGTRGFLQQADVPEIIMTQATRQSAFDAYLKTHVDANQAPFKVSGIEKWGGNLTDASLIIEDESKPLVLDLGQRAVTITPMTGHTSSDLVVVDQQSQVTFAGDLIWDGIFPNFMSSSPQKWIESVKKIASKPNRVIVPGHGSVCKSDSDGMKRYQILLDEIESHARSKFERGVEEAAAADAFALPSSIGDLRYFRSGFHEIAMSAWYRELRQDK